MKINKSLLKPSRDNDYLVEWIIDELPEDYPSLIYVDAFCGNINVLLHKEKSRIEVINDTDEGMTQIHRAIRDENKDFSKRLNSIKCNNETFQKFFANKDKKYEDYLEKAINEFVLRKLSKGEDKKMFSNKKIDWKKIAKEIMLLRVRLQETFIMNKDPLEIIGKFNHYDAIMYCDLPKNLKEQQYTKMSSMLSNFCGKVLVSCSDHKMYKTYFPTWNLRRKMFPGINKMKLEYIWKNY